jgi:hypothetical protein
MITSSSEFRENTSKATTDNVPLGVKPLPEMDYVNQGDVFGMGTYAQTVDNSKNAARIAPIL